MSTRRNSHRTTALGVRPRPLDRATPTYTAATTAAGLELPWTPCDAVAAPGVHTVFPGAPANPPKRRCRPAARHRPRPGPGPGPGPTPQPPLEPNRGNPARSDWNPPAVDHRQPSHRTPNSDDEAAADNPQSACSDDGRQLTVLHERAARSGSWLRCRHAAGAGTGAADRPAATAATGGRRCASGPAHPPRSGGRGAQPIRRIGRPRCCGRPAAPMARPLAQRRRRLLGSHWTYQLSGTGLLRREAGAMLETCG